MMKEITMRCNRYFPVLTDFGCEGITTATIVMDDGKRHNLPVSSGGLINFDDEWCSCVPEMCCDFVIETNVCRVSVHVNTPLDDL